MGADFNYVQLKYTHRGTNREGEQNKTVQRLSLCLADGEAILWHKWDQDIGLLAASPLSSLLSYRAPKRFTKRALISQILLSEWGKHFDNLL